MDLPFGDEDPQSTAIFGSKPAEEAIERVPLSAAAQAAVDALPEGSALLVVHKGPNSGARFLVDHNDTTAGRSTKSDIFLDDVTVSRKHAIFTHQDGAWTVRDAGSLNGTYVNRERTDSAVLSAGDEVQIGKYRMTFHPSGVTK